MRPSTAYGERWSLALFSSRESVDQLLHAVRAASVVERDGAALTIDIIVNGRPALADALAGPLADTADWGAGMTARLWSVPQPDKAHAWNVYLHTIAPPAQIAFFMDGYVVVERNALARLAEELRGRPNVLAATCVPSRGRSAAIQRARILSEGGLYGNLYALTERTCERLRAAGFRLPYGLYRNDSALGAALAFDLDPARSRWRSDRIAVVPEARYSTPVISPWKPAHLLAAVRRRMRQAQGLVETSALKAHLAGARRSPAEWPDSIDELVIQWADAQPAEARGLAAAAPLAWLALQNARRRPPRRTPPGATRLVQRYGARTQALCTALSATKIA